MGDAGVSNTFIFSCRFFSCTRMYRTSWGLSNVSGSGDTGNSGCSRMGEYGDDVRCGVVGATAGAGATASISTSPFEDAAAAAASAA